MRRRWLATTVFLVLAASADAEQLEFGMRSGVVWDSNVFGTPEDAGDDPLSDYSGRLSPFAAVSDPDGNLVWALRYQPSYEYYLHESELNGFDQTASGSLSWRFADRWRIQLSEGYAEFQSPVRFNQVAADPADPVILRVETNEVTSSATNAVLSYGLSRRDSLSLALSYRLIDYSSGQGNNRTIPSAVLAYERSLSETTTAGARLSWIQQQIERQSGEDDTTAFYNLSGFVNHSFSPTLRLELEGGPTFIDSSPADVFEPIQFGFARRSVLTGAGVVNVPVAINADTCGSFDPAVGGIRAELGFPLPCRGLMDGEVQVLSDQEVEVLSKQTTKVPTLDAQGSPLELSDSGGTDLTYFARVALTRTWETWDATLAYERSNSDSATFGSSAVADSLQLVLHWTPWVLWNVYLGAGVSLQEQTTEQVVPKQFVVRNAPAPPGVTSVARLAEVQSIIAESEDNAEKAWTQSVSFHVSRQLTRHSSAFAAVYWYGQRSELDAPNDRTTRWNDLSFWIGLDWKFDPIRF